LSNPSNPELSHSTIPTLAQLNDQRLKQWHQTGEALLTIENLRGWMNAAGLVLFAPRPQISSPASTLVEAMLGTPEPTPSMQQLSEARTLLARMVAEGLAVPLNLMGAAKGAATPDTPDYVASTAVFSYIFTLRGDKAWKQPPPTAGAAKVSHLALAIYEALKLRGALSAYDLSTEVGKEVTETAVLRSLGELWTNLRVLPLSQPDGGAPLWELTSARFLKQMKAGSNAGQPSALSALISLYLGQAVAATEEEIESFLSPLAPRSRIRDVVHALTAARELETIAVEGRTMLHVAGALPGFVAAPVQPAEDVIEVAAAGENVEPAADGDDLSRIKKFVAKPRKIGTGYLAKAKPSQFAARPAADRKPGSFSRKPGPPEDRERRPFIRSKSPGFDKPWQEDKPRRSPAPRKSFAPAEEGTGMDAASRPPRTERTYRPREDRAERPASSPRAKFGDKPAFRGKSKFGGEERSSRPAFPTRGDDAARPPRRTFSKAGSSDFPRKDFAKRSGEEGGPSRREFSPRPDRGTGRPPRREFPSRAEGGDSRPPRRAPGGFAGAKPYRGDAADKPRFPKRDFTGRPQTSEGRGEMTDSGKRVYRKFDAPRDRPARPFSSSRTSEGREGLGSNAGRPPRRFDDKPSGKFGERPRSKFGDKPAGKFGDKPGARASGFSGKPGGFAKKGFAKSDRPFKGKPGNTFEKFAGNKKPFGKRPPARKYKPGPGESA
jgi:23S rRNA pseudouridine2605 synthase